MFTDDKMELVYSETGKAVEAMKVLLQSIIDTFKGQDYIPIVELKRGNNIWKLFASRHKDKINPDGFKNMLMHKFPDRAQRIEELLG